MEVDRWNISISRDLAPRSARPEEGEQRDLTTDPRREIEDQRHHDVFGEANLLYQNLS
jgi:hypothetical protein